MAITKEPGQQGINWSNIAVGEVHLLPNVEPFTYSRPNLGGIMNMVRRSYVIIQICDPDVV